MDLKLGGKYKIGKKLGAGAFGEVYIAKDTATGEDVAVKVEDNRTRHPQLICNTHHEKKRISKSKLANAFSNRRKAKSGEGCIQDGSCRENWELEHMLEQEHRLELEHGCHGFHTGHH